MDRTTAIVVTGFVGLLVAAQPAANGQLGKEVGDLGAAFVSLTISLVIVGVLLVTVGDVGRLTTGLSHVRPEHVLGGVAGAAVVLVSLITVRSLGAGGVTAALVATQLLGAIALDRAGVLGLDGSPITLRHVLGVVLLLGGMTLVTTTG